MIAGIIVLVVAALLMVVAAYDIYRIGRDKPEELVDPPESALGLLDDDIVYRDMERDER